MPYQSNSVDDNRPKLSSTSRRAVLATGLTFGLAGCMQPLLEEGEEAANGAENSSDGTNGSDDGADDGEDDDEDEEPDAWQPVAIEEGWRENGFYSDVPVAGDELLYSSYRDKIVGIDPESGRHVWEHTTDGRIYADVSVGPERVYGGGEAGILYAVDRESGDLDWEFEVPSDDVRIRSLSVVGENVVAVADADGVTYGLDKESGEKLWSHSGSSITIQNTSRELGQAVDGKFVLQGGERDRVRVIEAESGDVQWEGDDQVWAAPTVDDDVVFAPVTQDAVVAYDMANGDELWRSDLFDTPYSRPSVADGQVFLGSNDNSVWSFDVDDGEERWRYQTGGSVTARTPVYRGWVFAPSSDGTLYVLDPDSGDVELEIELEPQGGNGTAELSYAPAPHGDDLFLYAESSLIKLAVDWEEQYDD